MTVRSSLATDIENRSAQRYIRAGRRPAPHVTLPSDRAPRRRDRVRQSARVGPPGRRLRHVGYAAGQRIFGQNLSVASATVATGHGDWKEHSR